MNKNRSDGGAQKAVITAMNILAYRDNSEQSLRRKLTDRGFDRETVDEAVELLRERGLIDDSALVAKTVEYLANVKLFGRSRIAHELLKRGFRRDTVVTINYDECCPDTDFIANCARLLISRGGTLDERSFNYLRRCGYSASEIFSAAKLLRE